jgi:hypothetical protein
VTGFRIDEVIGVLDGDMEFLIKHTSLQSLTSALQIMEATCARETGSEVTLQEYYSQKDQHVLEKDLESLIRTMLSISTQDAVSEVTPFFRTLISDPRYGENGVDWKRAQEQVPYAFSKVWKLLSKKVTSRTWNKDLFTSERRCFGLARPGLKEGDEI